MIYRSATETFAWQSTAYCTVKAEVLNQKHPPSRAAPFRLQYYASAGMAAMCGTAARSGRVHRGICREGCLPVARQQRARARRNLQARQPMHKSERHQRPYADMDTMDQQPAAVHEGGAPAWGRLALRSSPRRRELPPHHPVRPLKTAISTHASSLSLLLLLRNPSSWNIAPIIAWSSPLPPSVCWSGGGWRQLLMPRAPPHPARLTSGPRQPA
jgi:hypothetical protein